jgi:hypothetical protein
VICNVHVIYIFGCRKEGRKKVVRNESIAGADARVRVADV